MPPASWKGGSGNGGIKPFGTGGDTHTHTIILIARPSNWGIMVKIIYDLQKTQAVNSLKYIKILYTGNMQGG